MSPPEFHHGYVMPEPSILVSDFLDRKNIAPGNKLLSCLVPIRSSRIGIGFDRGGGQ